MKYLLDTHTLIWSLVDEAKLTDKTRELLFVEPSVYISVVSLWEISIKFQLGKLELDGRSPEETWRAAERIGFKLLPLSANEVLGFL